MYMSGELSRREKIMKLLSFDRGITPSQISTELYHRFDIKQSSSKIVEDISHISQSVEHESKIIEVVPPKCKECSFDNFHSLLNIPSSCPNCKSERVMEPKYRIVSVEQ